ncbi:oligosaccharide flippase family protein [Ruegeria marina]|uniref:Membrane protein involved in the export of O-antigen and teichoic acid n=1 Tax=Ruegeria marina TaxID=639004 RepID=A0A1G6IBC0_9RHOB|nr:oligosaccharide flippase family protein [Ruegeria marina]SDC03837.1 Membrane protein involved in the export of O-antigen and teichoic acid [Ruegeria marina]
MTKSHEPQKKPETALSGGSWTVVSRVFVQLAQFTILIFAARMMSPEEFGLFAFVAAFIVILNQLATAGWPEYIMQCEDDVYRLRGTLLVAMLSGGAVVILGVVISLFAHVATDAPDATRVGLVLAFSVFFSSTGAAYGGVLNHQNKLTASALSVMIGEAVNLVVAIWALYAGHGVLALAYGRLANSFTWCLSAAVASRLSPVRQIPLSLVGEMAQFSKHIIATRILVNLRIYAATFVIAGFMGAAAVGYFRAGQRIVSAFEEIVGEPTRVLAWNLFRKVRNRETQGDGFDGFSQVFFRIQLYAATPIFVGVAVLAPILVDALLGADWAPAAPVVQILALASLIRIPGHATVPIMSLSGKTELLPRLILIYSVISISCVTIGARFGLVTTALAEVVAAIMVFIISAVVMRRQLNINWARILFQSWRIFPALLAALALPLLVQHTGVMQHMSPLARFLLLCLCILLVYIPVLLILDRNLNGSIRGALARRR